VAKAGYYGASVVNTNAATACPTGSSSAAASTAASTAITACTQLAPGYYISATAASGSAPATCIAGSFCLGATTATPAIASGVLGAASTAVFGLTACPAGTTNAITLGALVGANAKDATVCDDLAPGYAILAAIPAQVAAGAITALTTGITQCAQGHWCPGVALGVNAITAGTTGSTFTWTLVAAITGGNAASGSPQPCGAGLSSVAGSIAASACTLVAPGYYIDPSHLTTPSVCAVGEYCPGSGGLYLNAAGTATATLTLAVGTAGGEYNCPTGSATPGTVASAANSALADCNLLPNFYIPSTATGAALYVPVSCPAGSHCPGGTAIGTAGGALVCPAGSTIPACTATTTNVAAPGPVTTTVSPTSQPINLNATPVVVNLPASAAPLAAAANSAVLALAALLALVAF
jgi:hypothetical protein